MKYSPGDEVHVERLGKGIVREVRNRDRYVVEVKGRAMVVAAETLSALPAGKRRQSANPARPQSDEAPAVPRAGAATSLDLHGLTIVEAVAALDEFLDRAIRAGMAEVLVIHGRSGGRLKSAVHARLAQLPPVRQFRLQAHNSGVTIVFL